MRTSRRIRCTRRRDHQFALLLRQLRKFRSEGPERVRKRGTGLRRLHCSHHSAEGRVARDRPRAARMRSTDAPKPSERATCSPNLLMAGCKEWQISGLMRTGRRPVVCQAVLALSMLGCAGVHVERTQTAQGSGFDLVCARGDQCEHKAEKLCRQGYRVIARSEPNDNPDGRHHWSIVCGDSEQGADLAATPTAQETTTGSPNVTGAQGESAAAESPSASDSNPRWSFSPTPASGMPPPAAPRRQPPAGPRPPPRSCSPPRAAAARDRRRWRLALCWVVAQP